MKNVTPITDDAANLSPAQLFDGLMEDLKSFELEPTSAMVIAWKGNEDGSVGEMLVLQAGPAPASQRVYLLERAKFDMLMNQLAAEGEE